MFDMPLAAHIASGKPLVYGSRVPRLAVRTTNNADAASSTTTSNSDSSHHTSTINAAIPAFIAVAVFVLTTFVAMRAIRGLRGGGVSPVYRKSAEDEKPQLYEVHLGDAPPPVRTTGRWDQMMPVSLEYLPPYEPQSPSRPSSSRAPSLSPPAPPSPAARPSRSPSRERGRSRSSWGVFSDRSAASAPAEDPSRMRVAVLIAMPSPPTPGGGDHRSSWGSSVPASPPPAYLGLAEV
ncbi:hypothetical protein BV20DRAFT_1050483 [Pilatotrama ljubarskyi]|nr:hypothetical protein BV20DRAFT_1050483 [Pilatotrama ljubarskyi]